MEGFLISTPTLCAGIRCKVAWSRNCSVLSWQLLMTPTPFRASKTIASTRNVFSPPLSLIVFLALQCSRDDLVYFMGVTDVCFLNVSFVQSDLGRSGGQRIGGKTLLCKKQFDRAFTCSKWGSKKLWMTSQVHFLEVGPNAHAHKFCR